MTNREVLSKIPEHGSLAIERAGQQRVGFLERQAESYLPSFVLTHSFNFKSTDEGIRFWHNILDDLREQGL